MLKKNWHNKMCKSLLLLLVSFQSMASTDMLESIFESIPGEHEFGARSRFQEANDPWWGDATAWTTRVKVTSKFTLDDAEQWQLLVQPNFVAVHNDNYNSIAVMKRASPIPDTEGFNLTQANFSYKSEGNWQAKVGRQSLSYDNERMVGALEYWQTPQSFDAITFNYNDQMNWRVQYAYSNKVHRIFGKYATKNLPEEDIRYGLFERPAFELGQHQLDTSLLNVEYKTDDNFKVVVYNYLIDNKDYSPYSTKTTGLRLSDEFKPGRFKYAYTAEYAWQKSAYDNPVNYQVWYNLLEASIQYKSHIFQLGQETLSNDKGVGFQTTLGTNHKFQGWADVFDAYAAQRGVRDTFVSYRGRKNKLRWRIVYHDFNSYGGNARMGYEIDLELAYRFNRKWEVKLVHADYHTKDKQAAIPSANFDLKTWFISVAYNI